ncbi:hypothetical protein SprV_0702385400 [Sparganum proliferum]
MHISQILLWILYSPLLCQTCFPRLNEGKCPRHDHGIYLTDIVQFYVERFSSLKAILFYDDITRTDFSMIFNGRGFSDDCAFKTTFYEGGFSQFVCMITFPHVIIQVKRGDTHHAYDPGLALDTKFASSLPDLLSRPRKQRKVSTLQSRNLLNGFCAIPC